MSCEGLYGIDETFILHVSDRITAPHILRAHTATHEHVIID